MSTRISTVNFQRNLEKNHMGFIYLFLRNIILSALVPVAVAILLIGLLFCIAVAIIALAIFIAVAIPVAVVGGWWFLWTQMSQGFKFKFSIK